MCNNSHTKVCRDVQTSSFLCEVHAKFNVSSHPKNSVNSYTFIIAKFIIFKKRLVNVRCLNPFTSDVLEHKMVSEPKDMNDFDF